MLYLVNLLPLVQSMKKLTVISTTRMAISQMLRPLLRRLPKLSCPGVSSMSIPGISTAKLASLLTAAVFSANAERGKKVAPIC